MNTRFVKFNVATIVTHQHINKTSRNLFLAVCLVLISTGCASVDATFDKVSAGVSDKFGKKDDSAAQPLKAVEKTPPTKPNKKNSIINIQEKLRTLGYYSGPISGTLDARSEAAIQDFQLDKNLKIDGRPTPSLIEQIDKAIELEE